MARPQEAIPEDSLGSLLVPDTLATWAWMFGYAAVAATFLLVKRLPAAPAVVARLAVEPGVPVGTYVLTHLFAWLGAGPVFLVQALAGGSLYLLVRHFAQGGGAAAQTGHVLGIAALLSPAVLATALGDVSPDLFILPAVLGLALAAQKGAWATYLGSLFLLLLFTGIAPIALGLAGLALIIEGKYSWGVAALGVGLILAPALSLLLGHATPGAGIGAWYLAGAPPGLARELAHPGLLVAWVRSASAWKEVLYAVGPVAAFLALSGRRALNAWWIPAILLLLVHLGGGQTLLVGWGPLSLAAAGFIFVAVARSLAGVDLWSLGRMRTAAVVAIPPLLMAGYVLGRHLGV